MEYELSHYRRLYHTQRGGAKSRGIEFLLTFQEWCNFWGDDIDRRGSGPNDLQMQRCADTGPYALWNIRKGTPRQNSATVSKMHEKRKCEEAAADLQARWDAMMNEPSNPERDDLAEDEIERRRFRIKTTYDSNKSLY